VGPLGPTFIMDYNTLSRQLHTDGVTLLSLGHLRLKDMVKEHGPRLEKQWYDSGQTDFTVYDDPFYPYLMLDCYRGWSRMAAVNTITFCLDTGFSPKTITDVFAGSGQTTVLLAKAFPKAKVFYHNTCEDQVFVMRHLADIHEVTNIEVVSEAPSSELVVAFEAMEHLKDPLKFLLPILKPPAVKVYSDSSSFSIKSIGHFDFYNIDEVEIPGKDFKPYFFGELNQAGYWQSHLKKHFKYPRFFNGHPNVFVREL
jgi:hypothetical protein